MCFVSCDSNSVNQMQQYSIPPAEEPAVNERISENAALSHFCDTQTSEFKLEMAH